MEYITLSFKINYHCNFGDSLYICGGIEELGNWDIKQALPLQWTPNDIWVIEFKLPKKHYKYAEYKFIVNSTDLNFPCKDMHWEQNENRCLLLNGKSSFEEFWGHKHLTKMAKLTEDLIEKKIEQISQESIKIEETFENSNQQQLGNSVKKYEQKNRIEIFIKCDEKNDCSDFHKIMPLLLYLYHTKITAIQLLESIQGNPSFMKEFVGILQTLVEKLKRILFILMEILKLSEICVISIESEFFKFVSLKNAISQYTENFTNNIFICDLKNAVNSLIICMKIDNFSLVEDNIKSKVIEVTFGEASIKDSMQQLENMYKEKNRIEREMLEDKAKYSKLQLILELIFLCKNYYLSIKNHNTNEIKDYENQLKVLLMEILKIQKWDALNFYEVMGKINSTIFEKYKNVVTHEGCQQGFQNIVCPIIFNATYDINDFNTLYSFIDHSYSEIIDAAQNQSVYMKFRNDADRALLIFFLNYMLLHYAIRLKNPSFPYFDTSPCGEMDPFCQEQNTDLSLSNFALLRKRIADNFVSNQRLTEKWNRLNQDISNMEKFLMEQCEKYGAKDFCSLIEILMNLKKIKLAIFGDDQISLFSKLLEINSEIIKDSAKFIDEQDKIEIKYELAYLLMKGKEARSFKYLLEEMKAVVFF